MHSGAEFRAMAQTDCRSEMPLDAAQVGANTAAEDYRRALSVDTKRNKNDYVTDADRAAQDAIVNHIHSAFPNEPIVAEENDQQEHVPDSGPAWVIDPIDGTTNYVHGLPIWTASVSSVMDGELIGGATVLPATGDSYHADGNDLYLNGNAVTVSDRTDVETFVLGVLGSGAIGERSRYARLTSDVVTHFGDLRRLGCTTAALAFVASGHLDAAITATPKRPWDLLAGCHMVECAGGTVTTFDGTEWERATDFVIASNGQAHEEIRRVACGECV